MKPTKKQADVKRRANAITGPDAALALLAELLDEAAGGKTDYERRGARVSAWGALDEEGWRFVHHFAASLLREWVAAGDGSVGALNCLVDVLSHGITGLNSRAQRPDPAPHLRQIARHFLKWPVLLNARPEFRKDRDETLAMLRRLDVGGANRGRTARPLRGDLGATVEAYICILATERMLPDSRFASLKPLSLDSLREWQAAAWQLFQEEFGKDFENSPHLARLVRGVKRWKRRDVIRDFFEGAFRTVKVQLEKLGK